MKGDGMKITLSKLKKYADTMGATVEDQRIGMSHMCKVIAPKGKKFYCDSIHILVEDVYIPWKPDYEELYRRMSLGLEDCDDPICEWCHSELYE